MIRNPKSIVRSLGAIAILAATVGCPADESKGPSQQLQSPTGPFAGIAITIGANPQRLEVGDDERTSRIAVEVFRTADWTPVANGTEALFTATLGAIDSPSGARTATINLFDGKGAITLFPGTTSGTARVTVEILGVIASVNIAIDPDPTGGEPPVPAPTASTLTLTASPSSLSEETAQDGDGPQSIMLTATVLGSDGDPFKGGGIFFTTPLGTFSNGDATSAIFKTNSAGQVIEFLSVEDAALLAFSGSSFQVTAHLGIEGGEKTTTVTINITAGPALPAPDNVVLTSNSNFVLDDDGSDAGAAETLTLTATVFDQFGAVFEDGNVTFTSSNFPSVAFTPSASGTSDSSGEVVVTATFGGADITAHASNSISLTATLSRPGQSADTSTITIQIIRPPIADFSFAYQPPVTSGVTDTVIFTDTSTGGPTSWAWDFDVVAGASVDSSLQNPTHDFGTLPDACNPGGCSVMLTATNAAGSSSVTKVITIPAP